MFFHLICKPVVARMWNVICRRNNSVESRVINPHLITKIQIGKKLRDFELKTRMLCSWEEFLKKRDRQLFWFSWLMRFRIWIPGWIWTSSWMKIYNILSTYIHVVHTCSLLRTNMCDINLSTFIGQYYLQSIDRMRCHENGGILLRLKYNFSEYLETMCRRRSWNYFSNNPQYLSR